MKKIYTKKQILGITFMLLTMPLLSQTYNMPGGTINTCSGTFYDTGGAGGDYTNNQNITTTFCSDIPGEAIQLAFSAFSTESCCDHMTIYDGPSTASPAIGTYNGTNSPGTVIGSGTCITIRFTSDGSVFSSGWAAAISCVTPLPPGTNYNMPGGTINTCVGMFYDTGGAGGQYGNNQNITTTFCSDTPGEAVILNFTQFATEACCDQMIIYDGPNTGSPLWGAYAGTNSPGTITGSGDCLTIVFTSDGTATAAGWTASISCGTPGPPPPPPTPQECAGAIQICNDQAFSGNSLGPGDVQELNSSNQGCLSTEHQSSWYYFTPTVNGTLEFTINTTVDYDFAVWNSANCGNLGLPVRCSWSAQDGPTGLGNGATDNSEGAGGDAWVAPLDVVVGEFYVLLIDNFTADNTSFSIDFNFSSPDLLDCTPIVLPIVLVSFDATPVADHVVLDWVTKSERENDYFILQRSKDGAVWEMIGVVDGNGTTNETSIYQFIDESPLSGISYYRFKQVDFDGKVDFSPIRTVNYHNVDMIKVYPIPSGNEFFVDLNGYDYNRAELIDLSGRLVQTEINRLEENKLEVTVLNNSAGVYTIRLYGNHGEVISKKVVLK